MQNWMGKGESQKKKGKSNVSNRVLWEDILEKYKDKKDRENKKKIIRKNKGLD